MTFLKQLFYTLLFSLTSIILLAQNSLSIEYKLELTETKLDIKELEGIRDLGQIKNLLESARYKIMYKGDKSRIEVKSLLVSMIMVSDFQAKKALILTSAMGDKSAQLLEGEMYDSLYELRSENEQKVILGSKTKKIAGYTCKDARLINSDGSETLLWYAPSLASKNNPLNRFQSPLIKGLILEMESDFNGITVRFQAHKIDDKEIDDKYLGFGIPKAYELKKPNLDQLKSGL